MTSYFVNYLFLSTWEPNHLYLPWQRPKVKEAPVAVARTDDDTKRQKANCDPGEKHQSI